MMTTDPDQAWLEAFAEAMGEASSEEQAFWERRQRLGLGVGLDEGGNLVYASSPTPQHPD
jgi:hypothetical protein